MSARGTMFFDSHSRHDRTWRRRAVGAGASAALLAFLTATATATAGAATAARSTRPRVTFGLPASANAGTPISFRWAASAVPRGSRVLLEQPAGSGHGWQTVLELERAHGPVARTSGTAVIPADGIAAGVSYRLAVVTARGKIAATSVKAVNVFGEVPLETLSGLPASDDGVYPAPAQPFTYWQGFYGNTDGPIMSIAARDNHCRSVTLDYVEGSDPDDWSDEAADVETVTITPASGRAVSTSAPFDQAGSVTAQLVPGQAWSVSASDVVSGISFVYVDGEASCDSANAWSISSDW